MATDVKYMTVKEAAEALGVSPNTVRALGGEWETARVSPSPEQLSVV